MNRDPVLRRAAISWARGGELTPQRLWPVLRARGGAEAFLASSEADLAELLESGARARAVLRSAEDLPAERWAGQLERSGIRIVTAFDEDYPAPLSEIPDPPFVLYAAGNLERFRLPAVGRGGVAGGHAVRPGRGGAALARARRSRADDRLGLRPGRGRGRPPGGARDGPGGTIAVLGCGLDVEYPREHAGLKKAILARDLVVSEFPPGTEPQPQNFPVRNRIIAGTLRRGRRRRGVAPERLSHHRAAGRRVRPRRLRRARERLLARPRRARTSSCATARSSAAERRTSSRSSSRRSEARPAGGPAAAPAADLSVRGSPALWETLLREEDALGRRPRPGDRPAGRDGARRPLRARGGRPRPLGEGGRYGARSELT